MGKSKNKIIKNNTLTKEVTPKYTVKQAITNYYLLIMFTIFPLFFTNMFFNIRHDKYYLFIVLTGTLLAAILLIVLTASTKQTSSKKIREDIVPWYKKLSFTDFAVIAFVAVNMISTLLSDFKESSLFGESTSISSSGRNNGLVLILFYAVAYFIVTRFFHYYEYIFAAFSVASSIVFLLAILNGFYIDPIGMFKQLSDKQSLIFISTIGNINLLSSYICLALPVAIAMSVHTKNNVLRVIYLITSGLGFASLMVADSDSGILGIGVFLAILLIWYARRVDRLKRYFLAVSVMLFFAKLLRLFSMIMNDKNKGMDTYQMFFVYDNTSYIIFAVCVAVALVLYYLDYKKSDIILPKAVPIIIGSIFALLIATIVSTVIYFSVFDTKTDLGGFKTILRFNDKWGTHRGFMWIRSMWIFSDAPILQKLFGTGPDTFYFAFKPYFSELLKFGDSSTNAAHNEYINYLITIGITGLGAYCAIIGSAITRAVKYAKKNPLCIVCASAVICYSIQAVVNISQPITTPMLFIFIALCEALSRSKTECKTLV